MVPQKVSTPVHVAKKARLDSQCLWCAQCFAMFALVGNIHACLHAKFGGHKSGGSSPHPLPTQSPNLYNLSDIHLSDQWAFIP